MKVARHEKIMELIRQYDIDTQEELAARLNEAGFKVTQATVSRDLRALKMTKVTGKDGKSHYAILSEAAAESVSYTHLLENWKRRIRRQCRRSMSIFWNSWKRSTRS